jgi:RND family efflux transporter MFP subunit
MHAKRNNTTDLAQTPGPDGVELRRSPLKFWLTVTIVVVLIITGVIAGIVPRFRQRAEVGAETRELSVPTVSVVSAETGKPTSGLDLPAEIKPLIEAPIYARASGYLKRRLVDIGTHVEAGQLLAEIDTPELDQDLDRARAQLAQAEASLGLARITATRWAGLLKTASVSEQEAAEKQADFKLKTALADSARAEVRRLEKLKSFSLVTAPFSGTVTIRNVDRGDLIVAAGNKEIFHLAQTERLRAFVQVPQAMARSVRPGQSAEVTIPELPGKSFPAKVLRTAGAIAADSRTLLVECELDNTKDEVFAGDYAQVRLTEAKPDASLTLPANTLLYRAEGPQVAVVKPDGKVDVRGVKLGRDFGQRIEVVAGVSSKDHVIVNPSDSIVSGAFVSAMQQNKATGGE